MNTTEFNASEPFSQYDAEVICRPLSHLLGSVFRGETILNKEGGQLNFCPLGRLRKTRKVVTTVPSNSSARILFTLSALARVVMEDVHDEHYMAHHAGKHPQTLCMQFANRETRFNIRSSLFAFLGFMAASSQEQFIFGANSNPMLHSDWRISVSFNAGNELFPRSEFIRDMYNALCRAFTDPEGSFQEDMIQPDAEVPEDSGDFVGVVNNITAKMVWHLKWLCIKEIHKIIPKQGTDEFTLWQRTTTQVDQEFAQQKAGALNAMADCFNSIFWELVAEELSDTEFMDNCSIYSGWQVYKGSAMSLLIKHLVRGFEQGGDEND